MPSLPGRLAWLGQRPVAYFAEKGMDVVGIDNNMRKEFFGEEASTAWVRERLKREFKSYTHRDVDIRNQSEISRIFERHRKDIKLIVHTAAQPSHDWATRNPMVDFTVNAQGTLVLLEAARQFAPEATFIFVSTNKVYGDNPNLLPLVELETRWEIDPEHPYVNGIPETMSIDRTMHSLFGASKVAADVMCKNVGATSGCVLPASAADV